MVTATITMFILKIWLPYWIRKPRPKFADSNSPTTTPTSDKPAVTFKVAMKVGTLLGSTTLVRICAFVAPAAAQGVFTTHRLSAALAAEAVTEAVAACTKQGYHVTATIVDPDGTTQAMLRGDGAGIVAVKSSYDKAYTVIMLGTTNNLDSSGAIA
jgi:Haem-degrading